MVRDYKAGKTPTINLDQMNASSELPNYVLLFAQE